MMEEDGSSVPAFEKPKGAVMRGRVFGFIGVIGIFAIAGWWAHRRPQTPVASPVKCNRLHENIRSEPEFVRFEQLGESMRIEGLLLTSGLPCAENVSGRDHNRSRTSKTCSGASTSIRG